mgnify:CR=1 FL=1
MISTMTANTANKVSTNPLYEVVIAAIKKWMFFLVIIHILFVFLSFGIIYPEIFIGSKNEFFCFGAIVYSLYVGGIIPLAIFWTLYYLEKNVPDRLIKKYRYKMFLFWVVFIFIIFIAIAMRFSGVFTPPLQLIVSGFLVVILALMVINHFLIYKNFYKNSTSEHP